MQDVKEESTTDLLEADDDGVSLREYLLTLWRHGLALIIVSLLCGAVVFGWTRLQPPVYEASVKMVISPPKTVQAGETAPAVSVATFRTMIENQTLAAAIVKEFRLDAEPLHLTPQRFLAGALTIATPRDTNVIILTIRLADRELAAKVANRLATLAIDLAERLSQDETVRTRDVIKAQMDQSRVQLEAAESRLADFRQKSQIEALKKDVEAELGQRSGLLPLTVEIETEQATLRKAEEELAKRERIGTVRRSIDNEPALMEAAKQATKSANGVLGLEMKNEYLSKVYEELDQQVAQSRAKLSGLERKRSQLVDTLKLNSGQLEKLNLLYAREAGLERLETEYDLAKKIYVDVATRYEQVRVQVEGRTAQLQLLDSALPPDGPVGPRVLRNTAAALVLGFVLATMAVLFLASVFPPVSSRP